MERDEKEEESGKEKIRAEKMKDFFKWPLIL